MIPKKIHFCWLSNDPYPQKIQKCINSWKEILPDYEIIKWDLNRFPLHNSVWVKEAYEAKKYAFAADYIRFYALYTEGGIYLDSDVEILKPFDDLLNLSYFLGRENVSNNIEAAAMGSHSKEPWVKDCLDFYENKHFITPKGLHEDTPLPCIMQRIFEQKYGTISINSPSEFNCSYSKIQIFPSSFFSPKNYLTNQIQITKNTYCIHHFTSTWRSTKDLFLNRIEGLFGKKIRTLFWLLLRNPIHNFQGSLKLIKTRKIWWT